jgi:23S rRNA pseudouridine2605 synthase
MRGSPDTRDDAAASATFKVVLHEGRNREVRRIWSAVGHEVIKLVRVRYGPIGLPGDLAAGKWRDAQAQSIEQLDAEASRPAAK